jgi:hypothetical protein
MDINFKKLNSILTSKTNKVIDKLEKLKCTSDDYKILLDTVFYNLEAVNKLKKFDNQCEDCLESKEENKDIKKEKIKENLIGKKWISFDKFKEELK